MSVTLLSINALIRPHSRAACSFCSFFALRRKKSGLLHDVIEDCEDVDRASLGNQFGADILAQEEEGIDWLEAQLYLVDTVGKERYLAEQMSGGTN